MMNQNKTSGIQVVRFLFVLPLLLTLLLSFRAQPILNNKDDGKGLDRFSKKYVSVTLNTSEGADRFSKKYVSVTLNTAKQEGSFFVPEKKRQQPFKPMLPTSKSAFAPIQDSLIWESGGKVLVVVRKSGVKEEYNLEVESQKREYIKKYGRLPNPPKQSIHVLSAVSMENPSDTIRIKYKSFD